MPYNVGVVRLAEYARSIGYDFVRHTGGGHILLRHSETGEYRCLPRRVTEGARNFNNCRADLAQGAGLSPRGRDAMEGTRRTTRQPTGEAAQRAATIIARLEERARRYEERAIEREDSTRIFFDSLMRQGMS